MTLPDESISSEAAPVQPEVLPYAAPAPPEPALGQKTARGFAWVLAATIASKVVSLVGQVVLARYLLVRDFDLWGKALTVISFAVLIRDAGPGLILVQRGRNFRRWSNAVFWMSLTQGVVAGIVMICVAPLSARAYGLNKIAPLLLVMGLVSPIFALSTVPSARMQTQLRFRAMTIMSLVGNTMIVLLSIILALAHCGVWSFLIPLPAVALLRTITYWIIAPTPLRWNPQVRRWRLLFGDSIWIFLLMVFSNVMAWGDNTMLGLFHRHDMEVVGIYYFAFALSTQMMNLLGWNLSQVLLPALSKLQDDRPRMTAAFLRAQRLLMLIGAPLCLLQAAVAAPMMHLLFGHNWDPAIPVFQVLSVGTAVRMAGSMGAGSMLQAQARFSLQFRLNVIYAIVFLAFVTVGGWAGGALSMAVAVSICFCILDTVNLYVAIRPGGGRWHDVWKIFAAPLALSAFAVAVALASRRLLIPPARSYNLLVIAEVSAVTLGVYALGLRLLMARQWHELAATVRNVIGRR